MGVGGGGCRGRLWEWTASSSWKLKKTSCSCPTPAGGRRPPSLTLVHPSRIRVPAVSEASIHARPPLSQSSDLAVSVAVITGAAVSESNGLLVSPPTSPQQWRRCGAARSPPTAVAALCRDSSGGAVSRQQWRRCGAARLRGYAPNHAPCCMHGQADPAPARAATGRSHSFAGPHIGLGRPPRCHHANTLTHQQA